MKYRFNLRTNKVVTLISRFLILLITLFFACKPSVLEGSSNEEFSVNAAKEWYYGVFKKSAEYALNNIKLKGDKSPTWNNAKYEKFGDIEVIEIPLSMERKLVSVPNFANQNNEDKKRIAQATINNLLIIRLPSKEIIVREIQYIPEIDYLRSRNFDISHLYYKAIDKEFDGIITIKKWNGERVNKYKLVDGLIKSKVKKGTKKIISNQRTSEEICVTVITTEQEMWCKGHYEGDILFIDECGEWEDTGNVTYEDFCEWLEDGGDSNCEDPTMTLEECFCESIGGRCGEGEAPWLNVGVIDDLSDPCSKNTKNLITDISCGTFLSKLFQSSFSNQGSTYNINFRQDQFRLGPTGYLLDAFSEFSSSTNTFSIYLNTNQINVYSKEYVGSIILHEIIHAFLSTQNPPVPDVDQHGEMVKSWITHMSTLMQAAFGISEIDANALAINGTGKAIYGDGITPPNTWNNFIHNSYGLYPSQFSSIAQDYKEKTNGKGTNCN